MGIKNGHQLASQQPQFIYNRGPVKPHFDYIFQNIHYTGLLYEIGVASIVRCEIKGPLMSSETFGLLNALESSSINRSIAATLSHSSDCHRRPGNINVMQSLLQSAVKPEEISLKMSNYP